MTTLIDVGDPPASSLSSCLRYIPGGCSLITESAKLRVFAVAGDPSGSALVGAAVPVELHLPLPEGSFPSDGDIPIDHCWSKDGAILTVLYRKKFAVYSQAQGLDEMARTLHRRHLDNTPPDGEGLSPPHGTSIFVEENSRLALQLLHSGQNGFEGKVVACCALEAVDHDTSSCPDPPGGHPSDRVGRGRRGHYMIAVGGSFGIECYALDVVVRFPSMDTDAGKQAPEGRETLGGGDEVNPSARGRLHSDDVSWRDPGFSDETADKQEEVPSASTSCRSLPCLFCGYPIVAVDFSPDSNLLAAVAMTGHVKVWDLSTLRTEPPVATPATPATAPPTPPQPQSRRHSTGSVRGRASGKGRGRGAGGRGTRDQKRKKGAHDRRKTFGSASGGGLRPSWTPTAEGQTALWSTSVRYRCPSHASKMFQSMCLKRYSSLPCNHPPGFTMNSDCCGGVWPVFSS